MEGHGHHWIMEQCLPNPLSSWALSSPRRHCIAAAAAAGVIKFLNEPDLQWTRDLITYHTSAVLPNLTVFLFFMNRSFLWESLSSRWVDVYCTTWLLMMFLIRLITLSKNKTNYWGQRATQLHTHCWGLVQHVLLENLEKQTCKLGLKSGKLRRCMI